MFLGATGASVTGPTGAGFTGASSTVTGPTGAAFTGATGNRYSTLCVFHETFLCVYAGASVTGPTGASSTVTGPTGDSFTGATGASVTGPTGGVADGVTQFATGSISNAQIQNMGTTPLTMVAAPGANLAHMVLACYVTYDYPGAGVPFSAGQMYVTPGKLVSGTSPVYGQKEAPFSFGTKVVAAIELGMSSDGFTSPYMEMTDFVNQPISLTTDPTLGTGVGTGRYFLLYKTITCPIV